MKYVVTIATLWVNTVYSSAHDRCKGPPLVRALFHSSVVAIALASVALSGCSEDRTTDSSSTTTAVENSRAADCTDLLECARLSSIDSAVPDQPTKATGEPITLGMINQENTPVGSYPELSAATRAAITFVNDELGGVNGRPVELDVCNTKFSAEGSTACAQQFVEAKVPAVLGGIDVFGNGIDTLGDNGIPFVGGIPVSTQSVTSANSFQWSGGTWGATIAFANHAATVLKAQRVAIIYGEFGSIADSAKVGETVLKQLGVTQVQLVPYPITATDLTSPLQAAAAGNPDALIVLAADTGCKAAYDGIETVGIEAQVYFVGACATPKILAEAGPTKTEGAMFNVEGSIRRDTPDPDFSLYDAVAAKYGKDFNPVGAGTVAFRSFMNLYRVLVDLPEDQITPAAITAALKSQVDAPSFMGHTSTCDGHQLKGLPALCSPQQILAQLKDGQLTQISDWVDVGAIYGKG